MERAIHSPSGESRARKPGDGKVATSQLVGRWTAPSSFVVPPLGELVQGLKQPPKGGTTSILRRTRYFHLPLRNYGACEESHLPDRHRVRPSRAAREGNVNVFTPRLESWHNRYPGKNDLSFQYG